MTIDKAIMFLDSMQNITRIQFDLSSDEKKSEMEAIMQIWDSVNILKDRIIELEKENGQLKINSNLTIRGIK